MKKSKVISFFVAVSLILSMFAGLTVWADEYTWEVPDENITDNSILFQWKDWDGNTALYKVNYGGKQTDVYPNSEGIYSFTLKDLNPSTTYTITVIPIHPGDWSWGSTRDLTAKTKSASHPAIGEVTVSRTSITVNLDSVSATGKNTATVYDVTSDREVVRDQEFTGTKFSISELQQFTAYRISINSTTNEFETLTTTKTTTGAKATEITDHSIKIEWGTLDPACSGHAYYTLYENWTEIKNQVYAQSSPLMLSDLKPNTEYEIQITPLKGDWGWCDQFWLYIKTLPEQSSGANEKVQAMHWNNDLGQEHYTDFGTALDKKQTVHHGTYQSDLMKVDVGYNIYLPAAYNAADTSKRYPVLYVLHGLGGNENTFIDTTWGFPYIGALQSLNDNVIIVFANNADYGWYTDSKDGLVPARSTVIEELIPHIDATYNTIADGKSRAIDGFSMGGQGALAMAFAHPDLFSSVIAYAPGLAHSLSSFVSMNWNDPLNQIFCYQEDQQASEEYYQSVNAFAMLEQNKQAVADAGMKTKLIWGDNDPVGNIATEDLYNELVKDGIDVSKKVIPGFNHSSPYYGNEGIESTNFHLGNLSFGSQGGGDEEVKELTAVDKTIDSVTLKWPSYDASYDFYKVYTYLNGVEVNVKDVTVAMGKGGSATVTGLAPGTAYTFTVWGGKTSDWSLIQSRTIAATTLTTDFPYLLSASSTINSVTLTYENIPEQDVNYMSVYQSVPGQPTAEEVLSNQEFTGPVYVHSGLGMGETYRYVLTPKDTAVGSWERVETVVTTKNPVLSASAQSSGITVRVTDGDPDWTCTISAVKTADGSPVLMNNGQASDTFTGTQYVHHELEPDTRYTYTVSPADSQAGWGPLVLNTKTTPVYAINVTALDETSVSLAWVAVDDTAAYKIKLTSPDGGTVPEKYVGGIDVSELTHTITGLAPNHQYNISVIALQNGSWSWQYTYSKSITTLAHVEGFEITKQGVNELTMRWPEVAGAAYFNVYQIQGGTEVLAGKSIDPVERTYKQIWLKQDSSFEYVVKAFGANGNEIQISGFDNTLSARTAADTRWNDDRGADYYTSGKLAGQNIRHETYHSDLMGLDVGYNIHIPAGYDPADQTKRYPVLYYLHPLGGNENSWVSDVWGANYVETLQNTKDDMFIVYVNNAQNQWYTDAANELYYGRSTILYELIPHIDRTYNTIASKRGRALDGFSMGGVGGLLLAFERPDLFNSIVTNSAAVSNSLQDFMNMAWGSENSVFGRDVNVDMANRYYDQEGIYGVYEKNKDWIKEEGLNIIMRWGQVDPVALISNQKMFDLLSENPGITITSEVIPNYDHSSVYYDGGRMHANLEFHKKNLDFSGTPAEKSWNIGSVNPFLGVVFFEQGAQALPSDTLVLAASYNEQDQMIDCQAVTVGDGVKTEFEPITSGAYVKVFLWSMDSITPMSESKRELIL